MSKIEAGGRQASETHQTRAASGGGERLYGETVRSCVAGASMRQARGVRMSARSDGGERSPEEAREEEKR